MLINDSLHKGSESLNNKELLNIKGANMLVKVLGQVVNVDNIDKIQLGIVGEHGSYVEVLLNSGKTFQLQDKDEEEVNKAVEKLIEKSNESSRLTRQLIQKLDYINTTLNRGR